MTDIQTARAQFLANLETFAKELYLYLRRLGVEAVAAEDLRQEVLLAAWQGLGRLRQPERLRSWLYGIAYRTYLTHQRQRTHEAAELIGDHPSIRNDPGSDANLSAHIVRQAILDLPDKYRQPLVLLYWQGLSYQEAAAVLATHVGTLAWRVHTALQLLHRALQEKGMKNGDFIQATTQDGIADSIGES
jgi:RNA polymerase sigma-70 factor, ECF subfamily